MQRSLLQVTLGYIGANVARLRVKRGMTQEELAERAGIDVRYSVRIQRGTERLSIEVLVALAEALETTPARLLRRAEPPTPRVGRPPASKRQRPHGPRSSG